jgi:putative transposase
MDYRSNRKVVFSCKYHVVFCPKYRRPVLVAGVDKRLKQLIAEVSKETDSLLLESKVMPDPIRILLDVDPQFGVHREVKAIKGRSSRLLRQEFPWLTIPSSDALDQQLFRLDSGRGATRRYQAIHREPEERLNAPRLPARRASPLPKNRQFGAARFVFNKARAIKRHCYKVRGDKLSAKHDLKPLLAIAKRSRRYGRRADFDAVSLQQACINLDRAFSQLL